MFETAPVSIRTDNAFVARDPDSNGGSTSHWIVRKRDFVLMLLISSTTLRLDRRFRIGRSFASPPAPPY